LLLLIFAVDATITVWRRGDRRRALVIGGSMIFGTILACHVPLAIWGIINVPFFLCFAYSGIVLAMGYELSNDMLRTAQLAQQLNASEADLRETQERMELAASAAELGMWLWDIVRNDIWITDKGRALFGFARSEKLDFNRFRSRVHPEDRESVLEAVENSLRSGAEYGCEYRVLLPDGQLRWIAGRGHVEFNGNGKPVRMRGASVDITKRKRAEEQAARQRNEMAHLSRVSTLGELSGSIAHELNLPLSSILSNAQAAQRVLAHGNADLAEVQEILDDIVSEDKRAGEVIHRLRQWLKRAEVQQHSLQINKVVQDVLKLIHSDLVNQKVIVDTEFARNLPTVTGDQVQLQQVLLNLLINACDAMCHCSTSDRRLLIRTGVENGSSAVIVSVTDRGSSIPEGKLENIFEPFFTTKEKGMGLGLSVCRSIITAHRGKLWATNNLDRGATFHMTLPVKVSGKKVGTNNNGITS
jgi:two-component system, LuxR family, sensor kinase FixL